MLTVPPTGGSFSTSAPPSPAPTAAIKQLPQNIPRLEPDGSNWAIFAMWFCEAMSANWQWGFFNGKSTQPMPTDASDVTADEQEAMDKWDYVDQVA